MNTKNINKNDALSINIIHNIISFCVLLIIVFCEGCTQNADESVQMLSVEHKMYDSNQNIKNNDPMPVQDVFLGAGDQIQVKSYSDNTINSEITLDKSGMFTLPLIGEVSYFDKGVIQLRNEIQQRYLRYLVRPEIEVIILALNSQKVLVLGQVQSPGVISLTTEMTIAEVIARSGGITAGANKSNMLHIRKNKHEVVVTKIDYNALLQGDGLKKDALVQHKDVIFVPESWLSVTATYMNYIGTILSPIISLEGGIVFYPEVKKVLSGNTDSPNVGTSVSVGD